MKRVFQAVLLVALLAGCAPAAIVDFSSLTGPVPILTPNFTSVGGVRFEYAPGGDISNPPVPCPFLGGAGSGYQYDFACVGGQVDPSGMNGTSDGTYLLDFALPAFQFSFDFGIFSLVSPVPDPPGYAVTALFYNGGNLVDVLPATPDPITLTGTLSYTGVVFNHVELQFDPGTQTDGTTGLPVYGQTLISTSNMDFTSVPEPGSAILLVLGLAGLGVARLKRRQ